MSRSLKILLGIGAAVVILWCACANVLLVVSLVFSRLVADQPAISQGQELLPVVESITTTAVPAAVGDSAAVTRIIDGDTIEVANNGASYRLRYIGMDTPERGQPFFAAATAANGLLVEGQTVTLVKDVSETDRYGRLLRYVYLPDGIFVNAELVAQGYAQVATFPSDVAVLATLLLRAKNWVLYLTLGSVKRQLMVNLGG
ncbi:MAG: thermonuclease family protein [Anaerolineae bacterium]|nr:thermonuclease family protein [Anaerolineae bacterium]